MAVEEPLRRVVAVRLGQAVGIFLGGDFLPVGEVEWNFDQRRIGDINLLVNSPTASLKLRRLSNTPKAQEYGQSSWGQ